MKGLKGLFQSVRWFGDLSTNKLRIFSQYSDRRVQLCPECHSEQKIYLGVTDIFPKPSEYMYKSKIRCRAGDYDFVKSVYERHSASLHGDGNEVIDFAMAVPQCSSPETMGIEDHRPTVTREELKERRKYVMRYVPYLYRGQNVGLRPMLFTEEDLIIAEEAGLFNPDII
jgi:hypothetical protein